MNILIVGGTGVLSSAVTAEALNQGYEVTMINRGNRPIPDGVVHIKSDKNNYGLIKDSLKGKRFDAVMDFLLLDDNETRESVEFYTQFAKQYFYISSCAVYDTKALDGKMGDEESPKELSIWSYSIEKWACEKMVMRLFEGKDAYYTIIRPCVTYDDTRIPYGISPMYGYHWTLVSRILEGKPIITWNGGKNKCNMTRVEDFASGVVGLIGNSNAYNEAFNVCGDETPSFSDVLKVLSSYLQKEVIRVDVDSEFYAKEVPYRAGEILGGRSIDSINSNKKLKEAVPLFCQTIDIKEGIGLTLATYRKLHFEKGIDWKYEGECDRIITKWCKKKRLDKKKYKRGFVDYLGNATIKDRLLYYGEYYKESFFIKVIKYPYKLLTIIKGH